MYPLVMNLESNSLALGFVIAVLVLFLISMYAARLYADAIVNGRTGEAGTWAWLGANIGLL